MHVGETAGAIGGEEAHGAHEDWTECVDGVDVGAEADVASAEIVCAHADDDAEVADIGTEGVNAEGRCVEVYCGAFACAPRGMAVGKSREAAAWREKQNSVTQTQGSEIVIPLWRTQMELPMAEEAGGGGEPTGEPAVWVGEVVVRA